jgi:predicted acylesterase/phospholipase RssA
MDLWRPNALLLGPGGVKGFLMLGSLLLFEKAKMLRGIKKIVGVSIGAVIGLFLSIGCSVTEIIELAFMTDLVELMSTIDFIHIMKKNGLVSHDVFRKRMRDKLSEKCGFVPTLKQLHLMTGIDFEVVVTNLDKDQAEYFGYANQPDLCSVEAVLMSMSLPLFFYTYVYKDNIYLDGGIADPFPIHRFAPDHSVLAIKLNGSPLDPKASFFNYIAKVVSCLTSQKRGFKLNHQKTKVLNLEYEINDAIGVKLTYEKRVDMVVVGFLCAHKFLSETQSPFLKTIENLMSKSFFQAIQYQPSKQVVIEYQSEIETDEIEDQGDEYLDECFDTDLSHEQTELDGEDEDEDEDGDEDGDEDEDRYVDEDQYGDGDLGEEDGDGDLEEDGDEDGDGDGDGEDNHEERYERYERYAEEKNDHPNEVYYQDYREYDVLDEDHLSKIHSIYNEKGSDSFVQDERYRFENGVWQRKYK